MVDKKSHFTQFLKKKTNKWKESVNRFERLCNDTSLSGRNTEHAFYAAITAIDQLENFNNDESISLTHQIENMHKLIENTKYYKFLYK